MIIRQRIFIGVLAVAWLVTTVNNTTYRCLRTLFYSSIQGRVLSGKLDTKMNGGRVRSRPLIEYSYTINDKDYKSDTFDVFGAYDQENIAKLATQRYEKDATCVVYFDHANPQISILSRDKSITYLALKVGSLSGVVLMFVVFTVCNQYKSNLNAPENGKNKCS
jgi:hypothetical protein